MISSNGTYAGYGNTRLHYRTWTPVGSMKAVVVIVHGGGDHSGRFGHVVDALLPHGFGICMPDLRGHGHSPGKRGHINTWGEYRQDLDLFMNLVRRLHPHLPLFLFGHSMGALIALDYCIRMQPEIKGLICTSPAVGELGIPPVMFRLAAILDKIWPAVVLPNGLVVRHLSRDLAFVRKTKSDPLYHTRSSPRFGMEMIRTVNFIRDHAADIQLPTYLIHGTDDKIASIEGSRHLAKTLPAELLTYKEYAGGYHELFNDLVKHEVLADLSEWITIKCEV